MNISAALKLATETLANSGLVEPRREASSLMEYAANRDRTFVITQPEYELTAAEEQLFTASLARRAGREPLQYITGRQEFYGLEFEVSPGVLIPRPETEILVEAAIELLEPMAKPTFMEVGLGSGCISVAILHNLQRAVGVATDISTAAIEVATANAERHHVTDRLTIQTADLYGDPNGKFDLIVSNPPYIPDGERADLQPEVRDFEPESALFAGAEGLTVIERLIAEAPTVLNLDGHILIEIGLGQAEKVVALFDEAKWIDVRFIKDLQGIDRIAIATLK